MTEITPLHKAFITITKLKKLLAEQKENKPDPIAIIGLSGRFPQANNKDEFWDLLCSGRNIISALPPKRWQLLNNTEEQITKNSAHAYWGGYLSDIEMFDAYFFGISPREALLMDPQQRLLLEVVYEAFEDAGLTVDKLAKSNTGVFASLYASQFGYMQAFENEMDALYIPTGNAISIAANRISYLFDLRGPSLIFDSACSSSLVAIQTACLNLQNKICELAVVGGVNINFLPSTNYLLTKAKMLSPDGQCKTFDKDANGYVQGEGVGAVILKPLANALKDKDRIYAVISGYAINQDGKTNGLTAPNGLQQEQLLRSAYKNANVEPKDISYVECHGTGTYLGDPIELQALGNVLSDAREKTSSCWIGSLKTNIGHLEPAAGIAGVIKVALAIKHGKIPPHLNFTEGNPYIDFDKYQLKIVAQLQPWLNNDKQRIAGVSSFGFGGTNAHLVLREFSQSKLEEKTIPGHAEIFTLSAKSFEALQELVNRWNVFLIKHSSINFSQLCYCTHVRRSHYYFRLAIISDSLTDLQNKLELLSRNIYSENNDIFLSKEQPNEAYVSNNLSDLGAVANDYVNHANIDWQKFEKERHFDHLDLPLYPWQHKKYWPAFKNRLSPITENSHPLQGKMILSPLKDKQFEFKLATKWLPELLDTYHVVHVGYYLEMLAFALAKIDCDFTSTTLEELVFLSATIVPDKIIVSIHLIITKQDDTKYHFSFYSSNNHEQNAWMECAKGKLTLETSSYHSPIESLDTIKQRGTLIPSPENLYNKIRAMGMPAGDSIRWTKQYWKGVNEILCELQEPNVCKEKSHFQLNIHPGIFDGCIQPIFAMLSDSITTPYMAASFNKIKMIFLNKQPMYLYIKLHEITTDQKVLGSAYLIDANNEVMAEFNNILLSPLENKLHLEKLLKVNSNLFEKLSDLAVEDRKPCIINFLIDQVAIIFSIPKEDVNIQLSLRDMGINSLMGLILIKILESHFQLTYSLENLLEGPTLSELADSILAKTKRLTQQESTKNILKETTWIAYREKIHHPKARLFCFPYGGGSASIYRDWQKILPAHLEVCPIQLPGRENRLSEKPIDNMQILIDALLTELKPYLDKPFGFFGHSMGALIAYELTCELRTLSMPLPTHLFVSAFPDPRLPPKSLNKLLKELEHNQILLSDIEQPEGIERLAEKQLYSLAHAFAESGLTEYKEFLLNKEISKILLPIFVSDMKLIRDYKYQDKKPLDLPMTVFLSKNDPWIPYEDHLTWIDHTTNTCNIFEYTAGHLFVKDSEIKQNILQKISHELDSFPIKEKV